MTVNEFESEQRSQKRNTAANAHQITLKLIDRMIPPEKILSKCINVSVFLNVCAPLFSEAM